jgi:indolepyruvate ferredoxin oxidoreductase alpha subunit
VHTHGGLVLAVADDPGMHSSQNEQDSRWYADFARVPCMEPSTQQEAYDMTREAFEISERFGVPVMLRLVTRLCHSRTTVEIGEGREQNPIRRAANRNSWILLPANARNQWRELLDRQKDIAAWSDDSPWNTLRLNPHRTDLGVITTGIARNYLRENLDDLGWAPSHLHIGAYPAPPHLLRELVGHVQRVLVLEDGQPFIERQLRGLFPPSIQIMGRVSGEVSETGELSPDVVRVALKLKLRPAMTLEGLELPNRPPQLCQGCPHIHAYHALQEAIAGHEHAMVTADIGCYTLGALPPLRVIESCVCMGASIGMARGASEAGVHPVIAVIGDSTFVHSGITALADAVVANANMTLLILDNETVGMTGAQDTVLPQSRLTDVILGLGVPVDQCTVVDAHPRKVHQNAEVIRKAIEHPGLSVVIARRECKVAAKRRQRAADAAAAAAAAKPSTARQEVTS